MSEFQNQLVCWIICEDQPFTAIESASLQSLFGLIKPDLYTPSADTIHNDIMEAYKKEYNNLHQKLQVKVFRLLSVILEISLNQIWLLTVFQILLQSTACKISFTIDI